MTDWRLIESAPTDGTHVDLLCGNEVTTDVYWGEVADADDDDPWGEGWLRDGEYALEEGSRPTHWRLTPTGFVQSGCWRYGAR